MYSFSPRRHATASDSLPSRSRAAASCSTCRHSGTGTLPTRGARSRGVARPEMLPAGRVRAHKQEGEGAGEGAGDLRVVFQRRGQGAHLLVLSAGHDVWAFCACVCAGVRTRACMRGRAREDASEAASRRARRSSAGGGGGDRARTPRPGLSTRSLSRSEAFAAAPRPSPGTPAAARPPRRTTGALSLREAVVSTSQSLTPYATRVQAPAHTQARRRRDAEPCALVPHPVSCVEHEPPAPLLRLAGGAEPSRDILSSKRAQRRVQQPVHWVRAPLFARAQKRRRCRCCRWRP